jgi:hypothetical protein
VTYTPLLSKHVLCTQSGAVRQWYHVGHPDINKQHVQLFFQEMATAQKVLTYIKHKETSSYTMTYVL